jgi:hypothetical protein
MPAYYNFSEFGLASNTISNYYEASIRVSIKLRWRRTF